ncbi:MAG: ABC transporter ATP-binding protein, partial [Intestinibacter bartlettii]|uniref:energy-coupling factor ABC transporter ATP-binding protein n=1 Tax=Intestinibacter bartlettii TaxID=261299 RepID=UPI0026F178A3
MRDISIEIKDLYYKYPDGYEALKGIDLTLYKGQSLGIVGSNGAGKSTLLLQLTGINRPSNGKIEINSLEVNKNNLAQIRKDIGFVFQNPEDQLFTTSIYEDVAFGPKN